MIFFYKNYSQYSKLATFFSMMGGIFYAFAIVSVIAGASDETMGIGAGLMMGAVMIVLGLGNNALAKSIAKSKGAPIGDDKKTDNAGNSDSKENVAEAKNYVVENTAKTEQVVQQVVKTEPVAEKVATKIEEVTEPEAVLVGGVQETLDNLETLKAREKCGEQENKVQSKNEWKCVYCGTLNTGKFCCECGKERIIAKFCPNCGEKLREGQKFCSNCGTKIAL